MNCSKDERRQIKKALFNRGKIYMDGTVTENVSAKSAGSHWIMYRLNRVSRKPKVRKFIDDFLEKFASWSSDDIKHKLTQIIQIVAKDTDKEDIEGFFARYVTTSAAEKKPSGTKILALFKPTLEVRVDLESYVQVGLSMLSHHVSRVKSLSRDLVARFSKARKDALTYDEINALVNDAIKDEKHRWKAGAIIEYECLSGGKMDREIFRGNKTREVTTQELAGMLANEEVMRQVADLKG